MDSRCRDRATTGTYSPSKMRRCTLRIVQTGNRVRMWDMAENQEDK